MTVEKKFREGKSVFLTGHTGFKGSWLTLWLNSLGAKVHGYSLEPPTQPNLFSLIQVESLLGTHTIADIRNYPLLKESMC